MKNADLHKAILNKTMTTQGWCVKYDFVAPLTIIISKVVLNENLSNTYIGKKLSSKWNLWKSLKKCFNNYQTQSSRDVLKKRCSGNMQPIYRRASIPKCDLTTASELCDVSSFNQKNFRLSKRGIRFVDLHCF